MDAKDRAKFINALGGNDGKDVPKEPIVASALPDEVVNVVRGDFQAEAEDSVFASGLPAWDMVPPQVVVRRKRRI